MPIEIVYDFTYPIIPVTGATEVVSQLSIDLVDAKGDGSASITRNPFDSSIQKVALLESGIFGAIMDSGLEAGTDVTSAGQTSFDLAVAAGPVAVDAWDYLSVAGRFTLSPGDDVTLTGVGGVAEAGQFLPVLANFNFANFPLLPISEPNAGDFDEDGDVDGFDFLKWQRGESPNPLSPTDRADWEANYGAFVPIIASSTGVPEPATWIALLCGMMALLFRHDVVVSYCSLAWVCGASLRAREASSGTRTQINPTDFPTAAVGSD